MQATGETHRRVASPGVPGIQRNIAITPCFSKTKPQIIICWLFKRKSSLFTVLETENSMVRVNQIWCGIRELSLEKLWHLCPNVLETINDDPHEFITS
jgi:hypothetical protein